MKESVLKTRVDKLLKAHRVSTGKSLWFQKLSDRYTSGLPDYIGATMGTPFALEIKASGKYARKLQQRVLDEMEKAGFETLASNNFDEIKKFIIRL